jgi:hypothetical protein
MEKIATELWIASNCSELRIYLINGLQNSYSVGPPKIKRLVLPVDFLRSLLAQII